MPILDVTDPISPGSRRPAVAFSETSTFVPVQGFKYHQLDFGGAAAGTVDVFVKWGTEKRKLATVNLADQERTALIVFGNIEEFELVPSGIAEASFSYVGGAV